MWGRVGGDGFQCRHCGTVDTAVSVVAAGSTAVIYFYTFITAVNVDNAVNIGVAVACGIGVIGTVRCAGIVIAGGVGNLVTVMVIIGVIGIVEAVAMIY